jgi:threonine/homoserine/homoserine lactone efflux protein
MNPALVSLMAFLPAATLLTITPGLDTALVLRYAVTGRPRGAVLAALGIAVGCFAWAAAVAVGLSALLSASQLAYTLLRWIGAAYLLWLGYRLLRFPRRDFIAPARNDREPRAAFASGALTNLLNPKVGIFYVSFLPQFVPHGVSVGTFIVLLGAIHALLGLAWFACLIAATRPIGAFLRRPAIVPACDRLTGGLFIAFGLGLALASRRP